ncbi:MAG: TIGR00282 family metallophosphoesterase [Erysipelotrichia bacterium]|jgi:metallophosphoesterase (TIGR00282 family)|nr:TIGR00282 family metallophosphoesterase [Erysipelotrichia bacterium]
MLRVLFVGDIVGKQGRKALSNHLPFLQEKYNYDLLIVNGENSAHGKGITKKIYDFFINLGVDCITMGNHTFSKDNIFTFIDDAGKLIRPANLEPENFGKAVHLIEFKNKKIGIFNVCGSIFMTNTTKTPFEALEKLLKDNPCDIKIVDIHAEATSEKYAFMQYFKKEVQMIVGTHTHIQTADEAIFDRCAFICDVGMTGPYNSVLGRDTDEVLTSMLDEIKTRYTISTEEAILSAVVVDIDLSELKAIKIERIQIRP